MIRETQLSDTEKIVQLMLQVDNEAEYLLFEPGERKLTIEQQKKVIASLQENSAIFVAEQKGKMVGYLIARRGAAKRNLHSVYLVIGVLSEFRGKGIGTQLFEEMEKWAVRNGIHRLELTVAAENQPGIALYKRMGFVIEGTKKYSLYIKGRFVDEYYMAKILPNGGMR